MILHPQTNLAGSKNEYSCVLKITNSIGSILLPGDIGEKTEKQLVDLYADRLKSDVLVVPHHGSKHSSSQNFLDYVQPKLALISAGYLNRYKHPSIEIYTRLQKAKIGILTTEECGAISLVFAEQRQLQPDCYRLNNILKF
jgi:competence protein ComEC